jgi:hypothetical protein
MRYPIVQRGAKSVGHHGGPRWRAGRSRDRPPSELHLDGICPWLGHCGSGYAQLRRSTRCNSQELDSAARDEPLGVENGYPRRKVAGLRSAEGVVGPEPANCLRAGAGRRDRPCWTPYKFDRSCCGLCWLNHTEAAALWSPPAWRVAEATYAMPLRQRSIDFQHRESAESTVLTERVLCYLRNR